MTKQVEILTEAVECIFERTTDCTTKQAFETLVSYIALKQGVPGVVVDKMSIAANVWLRQNLDMSVLTDKMADHFTDTMEELELIPKSNGHVHTDYKKISANIVRAIKACKDTPLLPMFTPPQISRMILMTFEKLGNNAVYVGVEPDLLQYRIALLNAKLYQVPAIILNANPDFHSLTPGSKNWKWVNMWDRPAWNEMEES